MPPPSSGPFCAGHSESSGRDSSGNRLRTRCIIGNQRHVAQSQVLVIPFKISECEGLVFLDRPTGRNAIVVSLELRDLSLIEEISGVQIAVTDKFVQAAMEFVSAGSGYNADLRPGLFPYSAP